MINADIQFEDADQPDNYRLGVSCAASYACLLTEAYLASAGS